MMASSENIKGVSKPTHMISRPPIIATPIDQIRLRRVISGTMVCSCLLIVAASAACRKRQKPLYAVIPKGQADIFWQTIHAGAAAAAREGNVDIDWNGPAMETDYTKQISIL